ncbi:50S ribosomal protein L3 [Deltaproteobacteria bacterium]|nr:50S ribosomal protein L3 [Deltaproteobacteria bacterium]
MANEKLGIVGKKLGMTQLFDASGAVRGVTVIEVTANTILQIKTTAGKDGYNAVQVGWGERKESRVTKAERGHFAKAGAPLATVVREFRVDAATAAGLEVGKQLTISDFFKEGQRIDVQGVSKGRGFAGVMKRHNFSGFHASHGVHEYYRHGGSIGTRLTPGMTMSGMKMPGHMGDAKLTVQNAKIEKIDVERNLIYLRGGVPGGDNAVLALRPAVKA